MNNLQRRIEKIEERRGMKRFRLRDIVLEFVDVVHDEDGRPHPGSCVGRMLMPAFGNPGEEGWIDDDGNSILPPAWVCEPMERRA